VKVALIGTGLMGRPMAEWLLGASYELVVWNRTREKTQPLERPGAGVAVTPAEAVQAASCIILMLTNVDAVRQCCGPSRPLISWVGRSSDRDHRSVRESGAAAEN